MKLIDIILSRDRRLVAPFATYPALKIVGATVSEALSDPRVHSKAALTTVSEFGCDVAFPLMDLTVEAEAFGVKVKFSTEEPPTVSEYIPTDEVGGLVCPRPESDGRLPLFVETARIMTQGSEGALTGFYLVGPFTLAGQLVGVSTLLRAVRRDPEMVSSLVELAAELMARYAGALADEGVDILAIAEPTAGLVSVKDFSRFSKQFIAEVVERVKACWVLHICGRSGHLLESMTEIGVDGISLDHNVDLLEASARIPNDVVLLGNYSPVKVAMEDESEVRGGVRQLMERMRDVPNFALSTGCDVPYKAPLENVKAFVEVGKAYPQPK